MGWEGGGVSLRKTRVSLTEGLGKGSTKYAIVGERCGEVMRFPVLHRRPPSPFRSPQQQKSLNSARDDCPGSAKLAWQHGMTEGAG